VGDAAGAGCIVATDIVHLHASAYQCFGYGDPTNDMVFRDGNYRGSAHIEIDDSYVANAAGDCIVDSVYDFKLSGGDVMSCGGAGKAQANSAGLHVAATSAGLSGSGSVIVRGVNFCDGYRPRANTSMEGVRLDRDVGYAVIADNLFRGCEHGLEAPARLPSIVASGNTPE